ncbi:MAG: helix-turn-helix transcriptional regulator [Marinosulfonomonas sp.]
MTTLIHPEALKALRTRKRWTQDQLCEATRGKNKVSLPTIKRIESAKDGPYKANDRVALILAKVLGTTPEELGKEPTEREQLERSLRKAGYRSSPRAMIDGETALAFDMVQEIYGISTRSQIEMAPLFMALLAEGSLDWRRKQVEAIDNALYELQDYAGGHSLYVNATGRVEEGVFRERESIERKDLFGVDVSEDVFDFGYDRSVNNPFADYLAELAKKVGANSVSFDKDLGWKTSEDLPSYRIGAEVVDRLTDCDPDAEYALLRGHVKVKDIPKELTPEERSSERIAWMIAHIPDEELREQREERDSWMSLLQRDALPEGRTNKASGGGENA